MGSVCRNAWGRSRELGNEVVYRLRQSVVVLYIRQYKLREELGGQSMSGPDMNQEHKSHEEGCGHSQIAAEP